MSWPARAWAAAFTTATACGPSATGTHYQGQPLFTINGQMVTAGAAPSRPIRLAVAWYADHSTLGGPQAIVTQDVQYEGKFPLDYDFSFYGPPPDSALNATTVAGATFRAAWGVLIAYEDLNGNGQLDIIEAGGSPVDQILATSIGDLFNGQPAANPVRVTYIDGPAPAALTGFTAGYNLYQGLSDPLPKNTLVELALSATQGPSELDLFVCPDFITGAYLASPNSAAHSYFDLPCNVPPTGGVRVAGSLLLANGVPSAWIRVTNGVDPLPQAVVTINGTPLTYSQADGVFEGTGSGFAVGDGGDDILAVTLDGGNYPAFTLTKPSDFAIEAPSPDVEPRFLAGAPIAVDWTSALGAAVYTVSLISTQYPYGDDLQVTGASGAGATQQTTLMAPDVDGPELLTVFAATSEQPVFHQGGSVVYPGTYRRAYIDLVPADAGLSAFGSVFLIHDAFGGTSTQTLVQPYEGSIPISAGASVAVDGQNVVWNMSQGGYYSRRIALDAGAACDVTVTAPGVTPFQTQVQIPGAFSIVPPTGPVSPGQVLDLSWSPSAGATGYNVVVEVSDGGQEILLNEVSTDAGAISMVMPTQSGWMDVAVVALGNQADRHFAGAVDDQLRIMVSSQ